MQGEKLLSVNPDYAMCEEFSNDIILFSVCTEFRCLQGFLQVFQGRLGTETAPRLVCMMGCCVEQKGDAPKRLLVFITHWTLHIESISSFYQIRVCQ